MKRRGAKREDGPERGERLQKLIAATGLASRREAERLIQAGRVSVDGRAVTELGTRVDPRRAEIAVDGKPLVTRVARRELMLYKPRGMLATLTDPQGGRPALGALLREQAPGAARLLPVGRLDFQAEGLLVLSSDGELARRLGRPDCGVPSTYQVRVQGQPSPATLQGLVRGVELEDGHAAVIESEVLKKNPSSTWLTLTLLDTRPRILPRLFERLGHTLLRSLRVSYGGLELGRLRERETRALTAEEAATLRGWGLDAPGDEG
ncbi:MAG TPA: pseudouridine synthase [Myxococcota bacterium]|nr:pseudouridine synthase [Myxococcota bacterium]HRY96112.1 pseudouridine synthase [Myxococcota bacterium]HSA23716.1 pseudouridine synthase [Myxococcota bacterium]